jgi:hypothetical protein
VRRKYENILTLANSLTGHFRDVVNSQRLLGENFAEMAQKSSELVDEFTLSCESHRQLVKHGEALLGTENSPFFCSLKPLSLTRFLYVTKTLKRELKPIHVESSNTLPQNDRRHAANRAQLRSSPTRIRRVQSGLGRVKIGHDEQHPIGSSAANPSTREPSERVPRQVREVAQRRRGENALPRRESSQGHAKTARSFPTRHIRLLRGQFARARNSHATIRQLDRLEFGP